MLKQAFKKRAATALHQHQFGIGNSNFRLFGSSAFETKLSGEMSSMKIAPAAGNWLRGYGVLPSQIGTPSGPKGHLTKQDVLAYITKNALQRIVI